MVGCRDLVGRRGMREEDRLINNLCPYVVQFSVSRKFARLRRRRPRIHNAISLHFLLPVPVLCTVEDLHIDTTARPTKRHN
jgi:hypothetical protein